MTLTVKGAQLYTEAVIKGVGILLNLPYYYGRAGEQYAFFRIPKLLLTDERFAEVSTDAKLMVSLPISHNILMTPLSLICQLVLLSLDVHSVSML